MTKENDEQQPGEEFTIPRIPRKPVRHVKVRYIMGGKLPPLSYHLDDDIEVEMDAVLNPKSSREITVKPVYKGKGELFTSPDTNEFLVDPK